MSITKVQASKLPVVSQRFASCESAQIASCESKTLRDKMLASLKPAILWVAVLRFSNLQGCNSALVDIKKYSKEHAKFSLNPLYSRILHDVPVCNFRYLHVLVWSFLYSCHAFK